MWRSQQHGWWPRLAFAAALLGLAFACQDATQVQVIVRTNVPFRDGLRVAIYSSGSGNYQGELASITGDPWLTDVGDLVITPNGDRSAPLAVRVVLGVGRDPNTCTEADAKGCIVAKRKLAFQPRKRLRVPITLFLACQDVVCGGDTTCNYLGQCVNAVVDPNVCASEAGCFIEGESPDTILAPPVADASTDAADADAGLDTGGDAAVTPLPSARTLAAGVNFTCAITQAGAVKCWGENPRGQLGLGDLTPRLALAELGANLPAVDLEAGRTAVELGVGSVHACARLDDDRLKCWGSNDYGQLGLGDVQPRGATPGSMGAALPGLDLGVKGNSRRFNGGGFHTCSLFEAGPVLKCWGIAIATGLGDNLDRGGAPNQMGGSLPPVNLGAGAKPVQLALGNLHACARLDGGAVKCWGHNSFGQLGLGDVIWRGQSDAFTMGDVLPAVNLGSGRTAVHITAGYFHSCAVLDNGQVKCWGNNDNGQLGLGDGAQRGIQPGQMGDALPPVDLGTGRRALLVESRGQSNCVLLDNRQVKCWGNNGKGQLGLGDSADRGGQPGQMGDTLPSVDLNVKTNLGELTELSVGGTHACVRYSLGAVRCWGEGGALGVGDNINRGDQPGQMGAQLAPAILE